MSESSESEFHDLVSMELDLGFDFLPKTTDIIDPLHSNFSKSIDFSLTIRDKKCFKRCVYISISTFVFVLVLFPLLHSGTREKETNIMPSKINLTLALNQALLFFDTQMRLGDANLVGGLYDSGNNFSTAYVVTLLSWTVIEYRQKYADIGELDHVKNIIMYGSDYLLKFFTEVGGNNQNRENDIDCWQNPVSDLAGETVAGLSAASLVFSGDQMYSRKLIHTAEKLFDLAHVQDPFRMTGVYTENNACGDRERFFYDSSGYVDELIFAGMWLFFATGNTNYLKYATDNFIAAEEEDTLSGKETPYWNKLAASSILLTRIRYFIDLGYPYEDALSTNRSELLMCAFLSSDHHTLSVTDGATAVFLSKLYSDYLRVLGRTVGTCSPDVFSVEELQDFAMSEVNYILGDKKDVVQETSFSSRTCLVAALIALYDHPVRYVDRNRYGGDLGIDKMGMFRNVHLV